MISAETASSGPRTRYRLHRLALAAVVLLGALSMPGPAASAAGTTPTPSGTAAAPTVLVGVAGLRLADVNATTMPTLWSMLSTGSIASIPGGIGGRSTCPGDAWATLSAGRDTRAATQAGGTDTDESTPSAPGLTAECADIPQPTVSDSPRSVAGPAFLSTPEPTDDSDATSATSGTVGTLGTALAQSGACTTAVGPGAAVMLAETTGHISRYLPDRSRLLGSDLNACPIMVVDAGRLPDVTAGRIQAMQDLDSWLADLRTELPRHTRLLVAGITDTHSAQPELQAVVDWTAPGGTPHWLTSGSTRNRQGVVQLVDLTATIAEAGGVPPTTFDGAPLVDGDSRRMDPTRSVANLRYLTVLSQTIATVMPALVGVVGLTLVLGLGGTLAARHAAARAGRPPYPGPRGRGILTAICLCAGATPVAASLAALSRWWVQPAPTLSLSVSLALAALVVALTAWLVSRRLPASPMALALSVSAITWLVLTVDGLTGTFLQQGSVLSSSPSFGARFYGFNNTTFAVYAAAALIFAGSLGALLPRRRLTVIVVIGAITTVVDGWPGFGADFGGVFALGPAFAVLGMLASQTTITVRRVLVALGATGAVVIAVAGIDRLMPTPTHVGRYVQRLMDGDGLDIMLRKAAGAWATVANPGGAIALLAVLAAGYALLQPRRCGLPAVAHAYETVPMLRPTVGSLIVAALLGSMLNDSGILIAVMFLLVSVAVLVASILAPISHSTQSGSVTAVPITPTLVTVGGGFLIALLLASAVLNAAPLRAPQAVAIAGEESRAERHDIVSDDAGIIVIGMTGVTWSDLRSAKLPVLSGLLADGASAGGVAHPTGAASDCVVGGWLAVSAGQIAAPRIAGQACPVPSVTTMGTTARVNDWSGYLEAQQGSPYGAVPGTLGEQLAAAQCATAVGPGAGIALAHPDGQIPRYRTLSAALASGTDAFDCPVTVIDAGDATIPRIPLDISTAMRADLRSHVRDAKVAAVDRMIRQVLSVAPEETTVVVVDLAGTPRTRPSLGAALVRVNPQGPERARFLTSSATRSDGVARVLDIPATILAGAGLPVSAPIQDSPLTHGSPRPTEATQASAVLAELTDRDLLRRGAYLYFVDYQLYLGLALAASCVALGRLRRLSPQWRSRLAVIGRTAALFVAAVPVSAFLVSLTGWWRFSNPSAMLAVSTIVIAATITAIALLAPRRPLWTAVGIVAGVTFAVLTLDGVIGTPLNRASPLGSVPTFGARFYGFGNPTFSIYAVAALVFSAAVAQELLRRGRTGRAVTAIAVIGVVTMVVDVWPSFGADLGGGLVIVPGFTVLGLTAMGSRVTWRKVLLVAVAGIGLVGVIGVADWLRPAASRSHLGRFVGQVLDGGAVETVARKAGYAARSILGGAPVWITVALLVAVALTLFGARRLTPLWFAAAEEQWPLVRPMTVSLWLVCVAGSVVNDFGLRIAMIALIAAVPLYTAIGLSAMANRTTADAGREPCADRR